MSEASDDVQRSKEDERYSTLLDIYESIHEPIGEGENGEWNADYSKVRICKSVLRQVVQSYYADLGRKKAFHGIALADRHKIAAYTVKWILRYRPVQFTGDEIPLSACLINEHFAMHAAACFLDLDINKVPDIEYDHMIYHFRHGDYQTNAWALTFCLLEKLYASDDE